MNLAFLVNFLIVCLQDIPGLLPFESYTEMNAIPIGKNSIVLNKAESSVIWGCREIATTKRL